MSQLIEVKVPDIGDFDAVPVIELFVKGSFVTLGTDGFGRSDTREQLRHFFEVDRHWVTLAALKALADEGVIGRDKVAAALVKYNLDPNKPNPMSV